MKDLSPSSITPMGAPHTVVQILGLVVAGFIGAWLTFSAAALSLMILVPWTAILLLCLVQIARHVQDDVFHPIVLVSVLYLFEFVTPLPIHRLTDEYLFLHGATDDAMSGALWLALASLSALNIFYGLSRKQLRFGSWSLRVDTRFLKLLLATVGSIGLISYFAYVWTIGGFAHLFSYTGGRAALGDVEGSGKFFYGYHLMLVAVFLGLGFIWSSRRRVIPGSLLLLSVVTLLALLGGRARAATPVIVAVVILHYLRRRISLTKVVLGVVIFFLSFAILGLFREQGRQLLSQNPSEALSAVIPSGDRFKVLLQIDMGRMDQTMAALHLNSRSGFYMGKTFASELGFVSHALADSGVDLPGSSAGELVRFSYPTSSDLVSPLPPGMVAELYMNFSWLGVVLGSALFGFLLQRLYGSWLAQRMEPRTVTIYAVALVYSLLLWHGSLSGLLTLLVLVIPSWLAASMVSSYGVTPAWGASADPYRRA